MVNLGPEGSHFEIHCLVGSATKWEKLRRLEKGHGLNGKNVLLVIGWSFRLHNQWAGRSSTHVRLSGVLRLIS
jgi:hypothetical protein